MQECEDREREDRRTMSAQSILCRAWWLTARIILQEILFAVVACGGGCKDCVMGCY